MKVVVGSDAVDLASVRVIRVSLDEIGEGFLKGRERIWIAELGVRENSGDGGLSEITAESGRSDGRSGIWRMLGGGAVEW